MVKFPRISHSLPIALYNLAIQTATTMGEKASAPGPLPTHNHIHASAPGPLATHIKLHAAPAPCILKSKNLDKLVNSPSARSPTMQERKAKFLKKRSPYWIFDSWHSYQHCCTLPSLEPGAILCS